MNRYVILGLVLLIGWSLLVRWFLRANPKQLAKVVRWTAVVLGGLGALYLLVMGRFGLAMMLLGILATVFTRLRSVFHHLKAAVGPTPGQSSAVETELLRMSLDHDSGDMDGEVLNGEFAGRRLSELSLAESLVLLRECRAGDAESATVLEAYLDRYHADTWRAADAGEAGFADQAMTREQAYLILGLKPGADEQEV
ncbi:MAG: molecular chaperone DnaJ, partial [Proteobacteria bacterium]|nr:molecular chaperone DnaJ [Pseudomonadota bacterium]